MTWFKEIFGFEEESPEQVRQNIRLEGNTFISNVNQRKFDAGIFEIPSLEELRKECLSFGSYSDKIQIAELVGDIQTIHQAKEYNGAVIQVASQFNLLEMVHPGITPENGITRYNLDKTQGPACAIACGAGTLYRNYFVPLGDQTGQTAEKQIDCLYDLGQALENEKRKLWEMKNGYALASGPGLKYISGILNGVSPDDYEFLKGKLRIGVHRDNEVTIGNTGNRITQVFCSALPVAYSNLDSALWADFARLILHALYEAAFITAIQNFERTGNNQLLLTLIGGGAFGNEQGWIFEAIRKAVFQYAHFPLDVKIVSYGRSGLSVQKFITSLNRDLT
jgi:hypothetical protein